VSVDVLTMGANKEGGRRDCVYQSTCERWQRMKGVGVMEVVSCVSVDVWRCEVMEVVCVSRRVAL
jgi:hypothetical protein